MPENKSAIVMQGRQAAANLATAMDAMNTYIVNFNACGYASNGEDPVTEADLTPSPQYGASAQPITMSDWEDFLYAANVMVEAYVAGQNKALGRIRP